MRISREDAKIKMSKSNERISYNYDKTKINSLDLNNLNLNNGYNYISQLKRDGQPDILYHGLVIKGKDYIIKTDSDYYCEKTGEEVCTNFSEISDEKYESEEYEKKNRVINPTSLRYFSAIRCDKCQGPHLKIACDIREEEFCYRCLGKNHIMRDCKNFKCFKCNRFGHRIHECKSKEEILCRRCNLLGHLQDDCLKYPMFKENINSEYFFKIEKNDSYMSKIEFLRKLFISDERNLNEKILQNLVNNIYCPFCAEKHSLKKCPNYINRDIREKTNMRRFNKK